MKQKLSTEIKFSQYPYRFSIKGHISQVPEKFIKKQQTINAKMLCTILKLT